MVDFIGLDVTDIGKSRVTRLEAMIETCVHPDDAAGFRTTLGHCLVTGQPFAMSYRLRRADESIAGCPVAPSPCAIKQGTPCSGTGSVTTSTIRWLPTTNSDAANGTFSDWSTLCRSISAVGRPRVSCPMSAGDTWRISASRSRISRHSPTRHTSDIDPVDAPEVQRRAAHARQAGEPFLMRYRRRGKDGNYRWTDGRFEPVRDQDGKIVEWYGLSIDVDDEVRVQEALRGSEQKLRQLIDAVPTLIWSTTPDGTPTYANRRLMDTVGVTLEELLAPNAPRSLADVHPDDRSAVELALSHSFETGDAFAMTYRQRKSVAGLEVRERQLYRAPIIRMDVRERLGPAFGASSSCQRDADGIHEPPVRVGRRSVR